MTRMSVLLSTAGTNWQDCHLFMSSTPLSFPDFEKGFTNPAGRDEFMIEGRVASCIARGRRRVICCVLSITGRLRSLTMGSFAGCI